MILKFTAEELAELLKHDSGPFGEASFESFLAEVCARTDEDTREVDLDRDDFARIEAVRTRRHKEIVESVFKRPMCKALGEFFG